MLSAAFVAAGLLVLGQAAPTTPPKSDPFYDTPANISSYGLGDIIRHRLSPNPLVNFFSNNLSSNAKEMHQVFYRTTNSIGMPAAAMTTIIIPFNANTTRLLSYQAAYDSADENCSPSYVLQKDDSNMSSLDLLSIIAALNQGWYVTTSDYEGTNAALASGVVAGQATLDAIRAALKTQAFTTLSPSAVYGMWGYSGGSIATEWATELQPAYAPELRSHFLGAAMGGHITNINSVIQGANKSPAAFLIPTGVVGLAAAYSNFSTWLDQNLIPSKRADFESVQNCTAAHNFANEDIYSYFKRGAAAFQDSVVQSVINITGIMGHHGTPQGPQYYYHGAGDELGPINQTDALVAKYCAAGASIDYVRDVAADHGLESITGLAGAFGWLKDRFAGQGQTGCTRQDVALTRPGEDAVVAFGDVFKALLDELLNQPLGPRQP